MIAPSVHSQPPTKGMDQRADRQYGRQASDSVRNRQNDLIPGKGSNGWRNYTGHSALGAQQLWDNLPAQGVVFSPVAEWDTAPLQRLSHLANVYILCDWRFDPAMFDHMVHGLGAEEGPYRGLGLRNHDGEKPIIAVPTEQVRAITGRSDDYGLFSEPAWLPGKEPWCRIVRLSRRIGELQRPVWLVYIVGNCVEIYQHMFIERGAVPKVLWVQCPLGGVRLARRRVWPGVQQGATATQLRGGPAPSTRLETAHRLPAFASMEPGVGLDPVRAS
jgi:hypothetical protein